MEYLKAFLIGGAFCAIGQVLVDYTKLTPARILVSYVVAGVILGGLGLYQPLLDFAGAGASVPLTGFGALIAKGTREAIASDGWTGILSGGVSASALGIGTAIFLKPCSGTTLQAKAKIGIHDIHRVTARRNR